MFVPEGKGKFRRLAVRTEGSLFQAFVVLASSKLEQAKQIGRRVCVLLRLIIVILGVFGLREVRKRLCGNLLSVPVCKPLVHGSSIALERILRDEMAFLRVGLFGLGILPASRPSRGHELHDTGWGFVGYCHDNPVKRQGQKGCRCEFRTITSAT